MSGMKETGGLGSKTHPTSDRSLQIKEAVIIYLSNVVNVVNKASTTVANTAIRISSLLRRGFACIVAVDVVVAAG